MTSTRLACVAVTRREREYEARERADTHEREKTRAIFPRATDFLRAGLTHSRQVLSSACYSGFSKINKRKHRPSILESVNESVLFCVCNLTRSLFLETKLLYVRKFCKE